MAAFRRRPVSAGSDCAPSGGSGITSSITPRRCWSIALIFIARAAVAASSDVRHRMLAQPSGEMTEYTAFSSASTTSPTAIASAPPEPPSPVITVTIGVRSRVIRPTERAMASAMPRSSDSGPGCAPGTSTNVTIGRPHRSASSITRIALR